MGGAVGVVVGRVWVEAVVGLLLGRGWVVVLRWMDTVLVMACEDLRGTERKHYNVKIVIILYISCSHERTNALYINYRCMDPVFINFRIKPLSSDPLSDS